MDPDTALSNSDYLTRQEVLSRRSRKLHQLTRLYKDQYWALMEQIKNQSGRYFWEYGKSPFVQEDGEVENNYNNNNNYNDIINNNVEWDNNTIDNHYGGDAEEGENKMGSMSLFSNCCAVQGCKTKAMQLTRYCNMHILRDDKQLLYKGCGYIIKRFDLDFFRFNVPLIVCVCFMCVICNVVYVL